MIGRFSRRVERRIFLLNDRLADLSREERLVVEELAYHRHIHDDAVRDALVTELRDDRVAAREAAAVVARFDRELERLRKQRAAVESKRARLLARLEDV